jgi:uncharacterized SAM-binding protein YcdF (DUF218 family)
MTVQPDDRLPKAPVTASRRWLRAAVVAVLAIMFVGAAIGFVGFLSQLRGAEIRPDRKADGIVVLTGGSSRVSDAMELLAAGYGRRLLISGVHPTVPPSIPAAMRRRRGAGRTSAASNR